MPPGEGHQYHHQYPMPASHKKERKPVLRQLLVDLRRIVLPRQPVVNIVRVELSGVLAGHWWVGGWYLRAFKTSVYSRDSRQKALLESPQYTSRPNFAFQIQNLSLVSASASGMRLKVPFLGSHGTFRQQRLFSPCTISRLGVRLFNLERPFLHPPSLSNSCPPSLPAAAAGRVVVDLGHRKQERLGVGFK